MHGNVGQNNDSNTKVGHYSTNNLPVDTSSHTNLIVDTGASHHFLQHSDLIHCTLPLTNIQKTPQGIRVLLPNKATMTSTHTASLQIPGLDNNALLAHMLSHLASGSLLSVGQLCDSGCTVTFNKNKLNIYHKGKINTARHTNKKQIVENR